MIQWEVLSSVEQTLSTRGKLFFSVLLMALSYTFFLITVSLAPPPIPDW